jgi:phosphatidylserine/phosphatidylglycerophosphate/cardiolipin synthase-like enzyme
MFAAIRGATDHINLETYIFDDDEAGGRFADLLLEQPRPSPAAGDRWPHCVHRRDQYQRHLPHWRSFLHNDEINAVILGRGFAAQMEVMFANDLALSDAIVLEHWRRRPLLWRVNEQLGRIGAYWL